MTENQKPPIGLRPAWIADEARLREVEEAMHRYHAAGLDIPIPWLRERIDLLTRIADRCERGVFDNESTGHTRHIFKPPLPFKKTGVFDKPAIPRVPSVGNCAHCGSPVHHGYPWWTGNPQHGGKPLHDECVEAYGLFA